MAIAGLRGIFWVIVSLLVMSTPAWLAPALVSIPLQSVLSNQQERTAVSGLLPAASSGMDYEDTRVDPDDYTYEEMMEGLEQLQSMDDTDLQHAPTGETSAMLSQKMVALEEEMGRVTKLMRAEKEAIQKRTLNLYEVVRKMMGTMEVLKEAASKEEHASIHVVDAGRRRRDSDVVADDFKDKSVWMDAKQQ